MNTVTLWLLISVGSSYVAAGYQTNVVERFATQQECERVKEIAKQPAYHKPHLVCVQATVARP